MTLLLPLALLQVGPSTTGLPIEPLPVPSKRQVETQQPAPEAADTRLSRCFAEVQRDAAAGRVLAEAWLAEAKQNAEANRCLGVALASLGEWSAAHRAFLAARNATTASEHASRARLGALAGNAALAAGDDEAALAVLAIAQAEALSAGNGELAASIGIDRATALVALKREDEAMGALDQARSANPANGQAWLLSATLYRRLDNLAGAQQQIAEAARLLPGEPLVGLEAGVIAVLLGRDEAARKSWQSVIDLAPQSEAAATAREYLAQLARE